MKIFGGEIRGYFDTYQKKILWFFLFLLLGYFLVKNIGLFIVKKKIENEWGKISTTQLKVGEIGFSLLGRSLFIHRLRLSDGETPIFQLGSFHVSLDLLPLLDRKIIVRNIRISYPHFFIQKEGERTNLSSLSKTKAAGQKREVASKGMSLEILIKKINIENFKLSYFEKFPKSKFEYVIDNGDLTISDVQYPKLVKAPLNGFLMLPKKGKVTLQGELSSSKLGQKQFKGTLEIKELSIEALKEFMIHHYALAPKSGVADLRSEIQLQGSELRSSHHLIVTDLALSGDASPVGVILGNTTNILMTFLGTLSNNKFDLKFRLDGDLAGDKADLIQMIGSAMAQAFYSQFNFLERNPAGQIKESTEKVLKTIEGIIP